MKHIGMVLVLVFFAVSCKQPAETAQNDAVAETKVASGTETKAAGELAFLKDMEGKYPGDVALLDNAAFAGRLEKLTGSRYAFLKEKWNVATPMEVKDGVFVASACEKYNCDATNFIVVYDFAADALHAGIREEGKAQAFDEDGKPDARVAAWASANVN